MFAPKYHREVTHHQATLHDALSLIQCLFAILLIHDSSAACHLNRVDVEIPAVEQLDYGIEPALAGNLTTLSSTVVLLSA